MKIELHKQFRVPVDGIMPIAEEIIIKKEKKKVLDAQRPYKNSDDAVPQNEAIQEKDKKDVKKELKVEKREKRKLKKELKLAF